MVCFRRFSSSLLIGFVLLMAVGLTGCLNLMATDAEPLDPTRTPIPTFTPTDIPPTADVAATEAAQAAMAQATADAAATAAAAPTDTPVPSEPTATSTPDSAVAVVNQGMNVRSGPGTNYSIIGAAQAGDQYVITGKDNSGGWWQVDFNGQSGWLFGQLVTANNSSGVAIAQNIPAPPPPTNTPVP
ncbi:MAG: SH3 domain-containing protein, partial [Caldilineaceae bacterium]|nr:SH3 domain-containing protein [Caldilineaceae bacterium]